MSWAGQRRATYAGTVVGVILFAAFFFYFVYLHEPATCFDGSQNGRESGIDCGGGCARICTEEARTPRTIWSQAFKIEDGLYNAVAYVENPNQAIAPEVRYTFSLFDADGALLIRESGVSFLPPSGTYPIFLGRLKTFDKTPTKVSFSIDEIPQWIKVEDTSSPFSVSATTLTGEDDTPRLSALIANEDLVEHQNVEAIATIFDTAGRPLQVSRTIIPRIEARKSAQATFTWPNPIAKAVKACRAASDIALLIDVSGSMNSDSTNPPQPLTDAKDAARLFVSKLSDRDAVSVITFATEAAVTQPLSYMHAQVGEGMSAIAIDPKEETGSTNIADAINDASAELETKGHEGARPVMVLLTDGKATAPGNEKAAAEAARTAASAAKGAGINIYTIALGAGADKALASAIASAPNQAYTAVRSSDLDTIYDAIGADLCEEGTAVIEVVPVSRSVFEGLIN